MSERHHATCTFSRLISAISYCWWLPVLYFFYTYGRFTTNTPVGDDIPLIIGRAVAIHEADGLFSALRVILAQSEEYRVAWIALSGWLSSKLFGYINFSLIGFLGNLSLFAALFLSLKLCARHYSQRHTLALIAFLLLASPLYADCMFWTNCSIGHFGSIFWGSVSCYFLANRGHRHFIGFELSSMAAMLTHGNGFGLLPLGFVGLYLFQDKAQRNKYLAIHGMITASILLISATNFDPRVTQLVMDYSVASMAQNPLQALLTIVQWFFAWTGSWASVSGKNHVLAFYVGVLEIGLIAYIIFKYKKLLIEKYGQVSLLAAYLLLTIAAASVTRSHLGLEISHIFTDRYRVYSLFLFTLVVMLIIVLSKENLKISAYHPLVLSIFLCVSTLYYVKINYDKQVFFVTYKNQQMKCAAEWAATQMAKPCTWHGDNKVLMDQAERIGILYIHANGTEPVRCQEPHLKYCWK